jgi:hypothetical protein
MADLTESDRDTHLLHSQGFTYLKALEKLNN